MSAHAKFKAQVDVSSLRDANNRLREINKKLIPKVLKRAMTTAAKGMRTDSKSVLSGNEIGFSKADIFANSKTVFPHVRGGSLRKKLTAGVSFPRADPSNIASFRNEAPTKKTSGKIRLSGQGVKAAVWSNKLKLYKGSFIWSRGESKTAFRRVKYSAKETPKKRTGGDGELRKYKRGKKKGAAYPRQPLEPVYGTSIPQVLNRVAPYRGTPPSSKILTLGLARFTKEYKRLVVVEMKRAAKKSKARRLK